MEEFENNEQLYKNLLVILKVFKNRPYHLAKYLIENKAFDDDFIKKIIDSEKINEISQDTKSPIRTLYFIDISHMTNYFNSLTDDEGSMSVNTVTIDLNSKLDKYLKEDKYEDAIRIRDYMNKHNIKRITQ